MSQQIPPSMHPSVVEDLSSSQGDRPIEHPHQARKITTNVTLNPRDSEFDTLPSIHWSDKPKAPPNFSNNMNGVENGGKCIPNAQSKTMETSNRDTVDGRGASIPDKQSGAPSHHQISTDYNVAHRSTANKSFRNTSSDDYSPPPSRTPPRKTGMTGYQPISPYKAQLKKRKSTNDCIDLTGRNEVLLQNIW
jgi:hypothetical protein